MSIIFGPCGKGSIQTLVENEGLYALIAKPLIQRISWSKWGPKINILIELGNQRILTLLRSLAILYSSILGNVYYSQLLFPARKYCQWDNGMIVIKMDT